MKSLLLALLCLGLFVQCSSSRPSTQQSPTHRSSISYGPGGKIIRHDVPNSVNASEQLTTKTEVEHENEQVVESPSVENSMEIEEESISTVRNASGQNQYHERRTPSRSTTTEFEDDEDDGFFSDYGPNIAIEILMFLFLIGAIVLLVYGYYGYAALAFFVILLAIVFPAMDDQSFLSIFIMIVSFLGALGGLLLAADEG